MDAIPTGLHLQFNVEEIYFGSALKNYEEAKVFRSTILERKGNLRWLDLFTEYLMWDLGDEIDFDFHPRDVESVDHATYRLSEAFGLLGQALVSINVFAVMTLEAHINSIAEANLNDAVWKTFDAMPLSDKWRNLPCLLGHSGFEPGAQPFQAFQKLIKKRNKLVHMKSTGRTHVIPDIKTKVDITSREDITPEQWMDRELTEAGSAIDVSKRMPLRLAELIKTEPPPWITVTELTFYRLQLRERDTP